MSVRRTTVEVPWRTLLKVIAAVALIWVWVQLWQLFLVLIVAILLAVTLNPVVVWLERHRLPRGAAAALVSAALLVLVAGLLWLTWSSLNEQARYLGTRLDTFEGEILPKLPPLLRDVLKPAGRGAGQSLVGTYGFRLVQSVTSAVTVALLGFVLMVYFLIEGRQTRDWLLAFVPARHRARAEQTLVEAQTVVFAYAAGNIITSIIAFVTTLVALSMLHVPAALLLAVMAGLSDFVPVIGFVVSAIPALVLAFTVSPMTVMLVVIVYIVYNVVEAYVLSPWAYGGRLKLSNVAVILAFAAGAELGGVIGALIALPIAALYPVVERLWLRRELPEETVRAHRSIEQRHSA